MSTATKLWYLAAAIGFAFCAGSRTPNAAQAAELPAIIEIRARRYEFSPAEITLKRGTPAVLRLTSDDRAHGFLLKPLNIDADIKPGQVTEIGVTPETSGEYDVICDHYCGIGHGSMKMKVTVIH